MKQFIAFLTLLALLSSCTIDRNNEEVTNLEENINKDFKELNISNFSYIIANEKNILIRKFQSPKNQHYINSEEIINNFRMPLVLKKMMDKSLIDENTALINYVPVIEDKSLKVLNLLKVPANQTELNPVQSSEITNYINKVLKATRGKASLQKLDLNIERVKHLDDKNLLKALAKLSLYFDSKNITGHLPSDSLIPNYFPNWYTRNIIYFAGWNVLKIDGHTIFWNFFSETKKSLLLIKVIDTGIFAAITYQSKKIPSPFDNNKSDLLQSPLATTILKSLLVSKRNNDGAFEKQLSQLKESKLNFLFMHDLFAHAKAYENIGNNKKADTLYRLYEKTFNEAIPIKYLKQPVLADFEDVPDNFDGKEFFELKKDTKVRLFGSGQLLNLAYQEYHLNSSDCIELYLDLFNKKTKLMNIKDGQYVFRFNYGYNKISGDYFSNKNIEFSYADPSDSVYILELKMPWNTLGKRKPKTGEIIGLNMMIGDDDMNEKWWKSGLSWSTKEWGAGWNNPSKWGSLILTQKPASERNKVVFCPKATTYIKIDGKIDNAWNRTEFVQINYSTGGVITSKFDNSGGFKALWDEQAIYLLFQIVDNVKSSAEIITTDKGWIENIRTGEIVYKMNGSKNTPFFPSFSTDKVFTLKSGKYFLRYTSDGGHSIEKWYGKSPVNCIYGAVLYKNIE